MISQTSSPTSTLSDAFRRAFRHHPAGVAVIAADPGDGPVALTVSSLISVSAAPPTVAFSLSTKSSGSAPVLRAGTLVIHLIRRQDRALAQLCATSGADRFGPGVRWTRLAGGEPRYTDVGIWFHARVLNRLPTGDATLVVAELIAGHVPEGTPSAEESSMVYLDRQWHGLSPLLEGAA